jgi:hypothetical protein
LAESVEVIEFQTTEAYSSLDRISELYKTRRLSRVEKEDIMHRIKPNNKIIIIIITTTTMTYNK